MSRMVAAATELPSDLGKLIEHIARRGDAPAITLVDAHLTAAGVADLARRAAAVLLDAGVRSGDPVLTVCDNGVAQLAAWLGCIEIGAVFAPLSTLLIGPPLAQIATHSGARVMVCQQRYRDQLVAVRELMPAVTTMLWAGGRDEQRGTVFETRLERASPDPPRATAVDPAAPARLMYTSGTTGDPKGVVWSRNAETMHALAYGDELVRIQPGEHVYSCLPLFHATCQGTLMGTLWRGGHITVDERFSPFSLWQRTRDCEAVFFPYVGTLLATLDRRPARSDDADNPVRRVMGSAAPALRWRAIEERFGILIEDVWGQTETASCWTLPQVTPATVGTIGRPVDRFGARVVGSDGREVAPGAPGELLIRAHQPHVLFDGYLGDPRPPWDSDGWYRTGDLVHEHESGDLVFDGRLREAIRRHGEMLSPSLVEVGAAGCPAIGSVAAVAVPSPDGVEDEIMLCITGSAGLEQVDDFMAAHVPRALRPRYYRRCEQLPMTPTTKIRRHELRALGVSGAWDRTTAAGPSMPGVGQAPR